MIIIRGLNKAFGEKIIFSNFNLEIAAVEKALCSI